MTLILVVRENGRFQDLTEDGLPRQYRVERDADGEGFHLYQIHRDEWVDGPRVMDIETVTGIGHLRIPL